MSERETVEALLEKWKAGERLTEREWVWLSYSPYGFSTGCGSK